MIPRATEKSSVWQYIPIFLEYYKIFMTFCNFKLSNFFLKLKILFTLFY